MRVPEFFVGKNIFLTGATGFVGKALIEKLLRSCPDVGNIYVLVRSKKGKTPQERWNAITQNLLFDKVKEKNPDNLKKVIPVDGNVVELGLGLSETDRRTITENVNIFYHIAASVRFDDPLQSAIFTNVRSTREIIALAKEAKNLDVFVHVSTAYCNCDKVEVDEIVYPSHGNWREAIKIAEEADPAVIAAMSSKYIDPLPNTYTYCKSLAEHTVLDLCLGQIPAVIVRPAIVISTFKEPVQGWSDNLNGPNGLLLAGGKGILRILWADTSGIQDYVPVDVVTRLIIISTYDKSRKRNLDEVEVYNASKYKDIPMTLEETMNMGKKLILDTPFSQILWYPNFTATTSWYNYYIQTLLFHMLPAFFIDLAFRLTGNKPMMLNVQKKVYIANCVLEYFIRIKFQFINTRSYSLFDSLLPEDKEEFGKDDFVSPSSDQIFQFYKNSKILLGEMMFKENFSDIEKNRKNLYRLWLLDIFCKILLIGTLFWLIFFKFGITNRMETSFRNYIHNL